MPDHDQQPTPAQAETPDYKLPAPSPGTGMFGAVTSLAGMAGGIPLVGSFVNEGLAFGNAGMGLYHGMEAKDAYNSGDMAEGSRQMDAADADVDSATGHLVNAIPLVGFARTWM